MVIWEGKIQNKETDLDLWFPTLLREVTNYENYKKLMSKYSEKLELLVERNNESGNV